jgi:two-component system chemotaxis sensor kinase CheA
MEEFKQGFIDEAYQLAEKLEEQLLNLEGTEVNDSDIQEIFRVMHTIKGSSAMFGFSNTEKITHELEDVYDLIRDNKLTISDAIIGHTLNTIDIVKALLHNNDTPDASNQKKYNEIITALDLILQDEGSQKMNQKQILKFFIRLMTKNQAVAITISFLSPTKIYFNEVLRL